MCVHSTDYHTVKRETRKLLFKVKFNNKCLSFIKKGLWLLVDSINVLIAFSLTFLSTIWWSCGRARRQTRRIYFLRWIKKSSGLLGRRHLAQVKKLISDRIFKSWFDKGNIPSFFLSLISLSTTSCRSFTTQSQLNPVPHFCKASFSMVNVWFSSLD